MSIGGKWIGAAVFSVLVGAGPALAVEGDSCPGDCDANGAVGVNEVVMGVNIALGSMAMEMCPPLDRGPDGNVTIDELVEAVTAMIKGCNCPVEADAFSGTFEAIQETVFARHGCASQACHDSVTKQGGLDLTPANAYANLIEVPSSQSSRQRVVPGEAERSFLWLKLAAKTDPSQIPNGEQVAGSPMPQIGEGLTVDELELLRRWIYGGAPETGTVPDTTALIDACLPPAKPITIKPLDPPAPEEGIQLVMPPWKLEAKSEHEICFATFYDVTDKIPPEFADPTGTAFYFRGQEIRQDPQSHHLILNRYLGPEADVHDPSFGTWTCAGGDLEGQECEPTDLASCGDTGICTSEIRESFACIGFGPGFGFNRIQVGGAQQAQAYIDFYPGVYAPMPTRGIFIWNSHAFNLTDQDTVMNGRINYYFTDDRQFLINPIFNASRIFSANAAPFTEQTICHDHVLPRGARLFSLSSHTHKHGKHFTVQHPDGSMIYENFIYNDPLTAKYDPPLEFDSPNEADRTLHFCSLYNNGVASDGSPDPETVTRSSRVPQSAQSSLGRCSPIACVSGKIGAPCNGSGDDRTCDSEPGANDGDCDACRITGGESTENEMFILIGQFYIDR